MQRDMVLEEDVVAEIALKSFATSRTSVHVQLTACARMHCRLRR